MLTNNLNSTTLNSYHSTALNNNASSSEKFENKFNEICHFISDFQRQYAEINSRDWDFFNISQIQFQAKKHLDQIKEFRTSFSKDSKERLIIDNVCLAVNHYINQFQAKEEQLHQLIANFANEGYCVEYEVLLDRGNQVLSSYQQFERSSNLCLLTLQLMQVLFSLNLNTSDLNDLRYEFNRLFELRVDGCMLVKDMSRRDIEVAQAELLYTYTDLELLLSKITSLYQKNPSANVDFENLITSFKKFIDQTDQFVTTVDDDEGAEKLKEKIKTVFAAHRHFVEQIKVSQQASLATHKATNLTSSNFNLLNIPQELKDLVARTQDFLNQDLLKGEKVPQLNFYNDLLPTIYRHLDRAKYLIGVTSLHEKISPYCPPNRYRQTMISLIKDQESYFKGAMPIAHNFHPTMQRFGNNVSVAILYHPALDYLYSNFKKKPKETFNTNTLLKWISLN